MGLMKGTKTERTSDLELVTTRTFKASAKTVFAAWTQPALFQRWWIPQSSGMTMVSCELDVRTGGSYRLEFALREHRMAFHGRYTLVVPGAKLVWTNEENGGEAVTTVTFEERDGQTLLTMHERYPSKAALDAEAEGMEGGRPESFSQLDELLASQSAGR
jgi:uncharacterized protein YndB with AHSA1/START domain